MEREIRGLVIPSDSELPVEVRQFGELVDYQKAVSGWIEAVDVPGLGVTLCVNEEGLPRRLPLNVRATFLWWHHDPLARGISILVGDVVVVGARVDEELGNDLDPEIVSDLTGPGPWGIRARLGIGVPERAHLPRTDIVLPLVSGDPRWFVGEARYGSYFDACGWATTVRAGTNVEEVELVLCTDRPALFEFEA